MLRLLEDLRQRFALAILRASPVPFGHRWLTAQVDLSTSPIRFKDRDGLCYTLDLSDHVMRQVFLHGRYEANTQRHLFRYLTPGMTFVDVGANIGAYALPVAHRLVEGNVLAFEPNPPALSMLRANTAANRLDNVQTIPFGLSDQATTLDLHGLGLTTASVHAHRDHSSTPIDVISLDQFLTDNSIPRVDVLKIDVEGHEMNVLRGATGVLGGTAPLMIILEIDDNCDRAGHTRDELFQFVRRFGFTGYLPRAWPFGLEPVDRVPPDYTDNVIFLRGLTTKTRSRARSRRPRHRRTRQR